MNFSFPADASDLLSCPRCGEDYLHHDKTVASDENGIAVTFWFWCEDCSGENGPIELTTAQNDGNTYLEWRYPGRAR